MGRVSLLSEKLLESFCCFYVCSPISVIPKSTNSQEEGNLKIMSNCQGTRHMHPQPAPSLPGSKTIGSQLSLGDELHEQQVRPKGERKIQEKVRLCEAGRQVTVRAVSGNEKFKSWAKEPLFQEADIKLALPWFASVMLLYLCSIYNQSFWSRTRSVFTYMNLIHTPS